MSIITLLTDFGVSSPYVAQMKGVIATRTPDVRIIDLTHSIPPQNVQAAAITLDDLAPWFPAGTIHLAVVDPGVGTDRLVLAAAVGDWYCVLPDNGLLSAFAARYEIKQIVALDRPEFWLSPVSNTFHGRDIMSPVAAAMTQGIALNQLGTQITNFVNLDIPSPQIEFDVIQGTVIYVDSFGNLVTNIKAEEVTCDDVFQIGHSQATSLVRSYAKRTKNELIALVGSSGRLEFAIVDGNCATHLSAGEGAPVRVIRGASCKENSRQ